MVEAIQMRVIHLVAGVLGELDLDSLRVPPEHLLADADELAGQIGSRKKPIGLGAHRTSTAHAVADRPLHIATPLLHPDLGSAFSLSARCHPGHRQCRAVTSRRPVTVGYLGWMQDGGHILGTAKDGEETHRGVAVIATAVPFRPRLQECLTCLEALVGAVFCEFNSEGSLEHVDVRGNGPSIRSPLPARSAGHRTKFRDAACWDMPVVPRQYCSNRWTPAIAGPAPELRCYWVDSLDAPLNLFGVILWSCVPDGDVRRQAVVDLLFASQLR